MGKWIVCCAWPYVNMVPHLGTFIHLLSADVYSRYLKLKGEDVISVTGSDEHGTPIEIEAIKQGVKPKDITDKYHNIIVELLDRYSIELSNYTRTENPTHKRFVQQVFTKIYLNGYIFTQEVMLPYCQSCSRFLPDRFVEGECPHCRFESARGDQCDSCGRVLEPLDLVNPRCLFCNSPPKPKATQHWFFNLPKFSKKIKKYLDTNSQLPLSVKNFSYRWIEEGLKSRALTRDNKWGIPAPFPNAEGKTIYVWFEAVLGYISAAIEWSEKKGNPNLWKTFWLDPKVKNIHFIGKDNIPFHTIIFPSLLMATHDPYILPWQIASTEFILYESQKFSKSRRIGLWVDDALDLADSDTWRYILMMMRPENKDANFTWNDFISMVNSDLNDSLGNFILRTLKFIWRQYNGEIPQHTSFKNEDKKLLREISESPAKIAQLMDKFRIRDALSSIVNLSRMGNQYLSKKEPWHAIEKNPQDASNVIYIAAQLVSTIAILIYPFMPRKSEAVLKQLRSNPIEYLHWEKAGKNIITPGHKISEPKLLFKKITRDEIKHFLESKGLSEDGSTKL